MKLLKKMVIGLSVALFIGTTSVSAGTYIVEPGDTVSGILHKLKFNSVEEAKLVTPSGDINKIFVGDILTYKSTKHKKRFVLKKTKNNKFCFKDNRSIHYRASERCK